MTDDTSCFLPNTVESRYPVKFKYNSVILCYVMRTTLLYSNSSDTRLTVPNSLQYPGYIPANLQNQLFLSFNSAIILSIDVGYCDVVTQGRDYLNILFWNTYNNANKYNINNCISELISDKSCDLIILAEYNDEISMLCQLVNKQSDEGYHPIPNYGGCARIKGLIKEGFALEIICEQARYQIAKIETVYFRLLIAMIHNVSKLRASDDMQEENLRCFHNDIRIEESKYNTSNTLIIGDLNVNPFEKSCVSASTLHAIPFLQEVRRPTRIVQKREYHKFYNPTWKLYSNRETPYTTYFYDNSDMVNYYWNAFDQVIIRPQLADAFDDDSLEIISDTRNHKLMQNNRPDKTNYSDHLPLFFSLKEDKIK